MSVDALSTQRFTLNMPKSLIQLGQAIRFRRLELGLSQEQLADRCGFDRTYISMLERAKRNPSFTNLLRIAEGLETSVSKLTEVFNGTDTN